MFQSRMGGIRAPARIGFRIGILTCILSSMTYHKIHMISDISFLFNIRNSFLSYLLELSSAEPRINTFPANFLYSATKNCLSLREACHGKTCIFQSCNTYHHRSYHRRTKHQSHTNRRYTSCLHFGRLQIYDLWGNISWNKVALGIQCSIFIHISCRQTCKVSIPCISCIQKKPCHNTSQYKTQDYDRAGTCSPSYWIAQTARVE